ncbi:hypothetical protein FACS189494_10080 [Spirochaetia bacterium]|nr:hypothetical protein FACS189494_10080 [Spirochaetia bacterium]
MIPANNIIEKVEVCMDEVIDVNEGDIDSIADELNENELNDDDIIDTNIVYDIEGSSLKVDTPVYQLRLTYSRETFYAFYYGEILPAGSMVMVPTRYGKDMAELIGQVYNVSAISMSRVSHIDRPATDEDISKLESNKQKETKAYEICKEKILERELKMKLVAVHCLLEDSKMVFFFTAENRVDFRELVKDLVGIFKIRIELRQIGIRDEARITGGLGICGRTFCCHSISDKLKPVSIKMAKDQNLSLNSMKISGPCGRLLCCLSYEHNFYSEQRCVMPQEGVRVTYNGSAWRVAEVNVVLGLVKLYSEDGGVMQLPKANFEKKENKWYIKDMALHTMNSK